MHRSQGGGVDASSVGGAAVLIGRRELHDSIGIASRLAGGKHCGSKDGCASFHRLSWGVRLDFGSKRCRYWESRRAMPGPTALRERKSWFRSCRASYADSWAATPDRSGVFDASTRTLASSNAAFWMVTGEQAVAKSERHAQGFRKDGPECLVNPLAATRFQRQQLFRHGRNRGHRENRRKKRWS